MTKGKDRLFLQYFVVLTNLQEDRCLILTFHQVVNGFEEPSHGFFKFHLFFAFVKPERRYIVVIPQANRQSRPLEECAGFKFHLKLKREEMGDGM